MKCCSCAREIPENSLYCNWCGKKQVKTKKRRRKRADGFGSVWKLQGKRSRPWVAQKDGQTVGYYATAKEADEALSLLVRTPLTKRYNYTLAQAHDLWEAEKFRTLGDKGQEGYRSAWKHLSPLYDSKLRDIRAEDWQRVIDAMRGKSRSTCDKVKQLASQISKWGIREELLQVNYAQFIVLPAEKKKPVVTFTPEDLEKLAAAQSDTADIILLLMYTGARINELFTVPLECCHDKWILWGSKSEAGRDRSIPIPDIILPRYTRIRQRALDSGGTRLIDGYSGSHDVSNFRKRDYYPLLDSLGIERKVPHTSRKTFISANVEAGTRPEILQTVVGHADYDTTLKYYTKFSPETLSAAVNKAVSYQQIPSKSEKCEKEKSP